MAALTGMQIYKLLPKTNCKDCGLPTCMAFAMQVAAKQKALSACPHASEEAKSALAESAAPPMRLVKIGTGPALFETGAETVMFRHEERFHHATGLAARVSASLSEKEALERVDRINASEFLRVGQKIRVSLAAIEIARGPEGVKALASRSKVPVILVGSDPGVMKACVQAVQALRPLIHGANASNLDAMADLAVAAKLPLSVSGAGVDELAELSARAKAKGVEDIVLVFSGKNAGETIRSLTVARRAALKKAFRPLGYPTMVELGDGSPESESVMAATFASKYAGIVMMSGLEPWAVLPVLASIQNIYTNPQVPNAVEAKLYEVGNPTPDSPVMFTTNFSLTFFSVQGEVERSKIPAYISVINTEGLGVLNAYAGDKLSAEKVIKVLNEQGVAGKVKHRKLIIPGLLPVFRAEIMDSSEWKEVIIGPESASKIPAFLNEVWR